MEREEATILLDQAQEALSDPDLPSHLRRYWQGILLESRRLTATSSEVSHGN